MIQPSESTRLVAASSVTPSLPARAMNTVTANTSRKICAPPGAPSLPPGTRNYMTRRGFETLKLELDQLVRDERPRLVETIRWAASNGDRSENGDYIYGKKRLREIDRRIRFLIKRLETATVVTPSEQENTEQVYFGATVTVCDVDGEDEQAAADAVSALFERRFDEDS